MERALGHDEVFVGVDVGTQGVRVVALDIQGELISERRVPFALGDHIEEQSPELWWSALLSLLRAVTADIDHARPRRRPIALSVTSTSGTVVPVDAGFQPVHAALMYGDKRSTVEAEMCRAAAHEVEKATVAAGSFNTSYGLPKILWFTRHFPADAQRIRLWCHAADFVLGRLTGSWGVTDPTSALKTGYDPLRRRWAPFITDRLGLPAEWLPRIVDSGSVLGTVVSAVTAETGLPPSVQVVAGMTDGCASQVAAGAVAPGEWSTTIGTTLVVKGVSRRPIVDPLGRLYNHQHPQGWWLPGGASNTGADWVARDFAGQDLAVLDGAARRLTPTPWTAYPLQQAGERFPFVSNAARGFEPHGLTTSERYAARMEGVAYLERLAYEVVERLSGEAVARVFTAGGGSRSETWLSIRSNVLRRPVVKMRHADAVVGAAIIAASRTAFPNLVSAARALTVPERTILPSALAATYEDGYQRFVAELTVRGYLAQEAVVRQ